ncbi:eukaryotic polypeptide chain release factor 3 [Lactarius hengduanensis]|nr:eukaryotic polypeptide chain release factor 3 [Lactarius hengduanensis]
MSRLNASAFEFVPGKRVSPPQQQPQSQQPPLPAFSPPPAAAVRDPEPVRAAQAAPPPVAKLPTVQAKAAPPSSSSTPTRTPGATSPAPASKTFTLGRAKTDTAAVAQEVATVADQEVLDDLFGDIKEHLNIVFIGHVDAGKSTMGGNILFLSGTVDKRTMEKYEREAKEAGPRDLERSKGKTVEVGRAYFETKARRYTILDAPGHKTFRPIDDLRRRAGGRRAARISARKGEFETASRRAGRPASHIMLVKTAGVNKIIVVINKMDDPTVRWDKARYEEIKEKLAPFVRGAGFHVKTDISWIPVSAYTGANLKDRVEKSVCAWWDGPSLLEHLDKCRWSIARCIRRTWARSPSASSSRAISAKVTCSCSCRTRMRSRVAAMYNELEEEVNLAVSGDNVRIRLRGVEDDDISPGFVLTSLQKPVHAVRQFEAQLAVLDHRNIICAGYSAVMHALLHYFDKTTGRKSRQAATRIVALIETTAPICVERFVDYPQLGRFTLRDEGTNYITSIIEGHADELSEATANLAIRNNAAAA